MFDGSPLALISLLVVMATTRPKLLHLIVTLISHSTELEGILAGFSVDSLGRMLKLSARNQSAT